MLKYYQWTPFILLFQAMLFYLPRMIWRSLNDKSGLDIQSLVDAVHQYHSDAAKYTDKEILLNYLTNLFNEYVSANKGLDLYGIKNADNQKLNEALKQQNMRKRVVTKDAKTSQSKNADDDSDYDEDDLDVKQSSYDDFIRSKANATSSFKRTSIICNRIFKIMCITKGKRFGNYLLALFVFVKILFTLNSVLQLFILNHFLGNDYFLLGIEVLGKIWAGDDWTQVKRFPRVTMCDFRIREVGIVHRYTVQCVLSINLFNEKIFIFLWFWICIICCFNVFDLISWLYTLVLNSHERYMYVKRRLTALNPALHLHGDSSPVFLNDIEDKRLFKKFVNSYLKEDGVLVLRLLSRNSHDLIVSEVLSNLYNLYKEQVKQRNKYFRTKNNDFDAMNPSNAHSEGNNNHYSQENELQLQYVSPGSEGKPTDQKLKNIHNSLRNTTVLAKKNHPYPNEQI